MHIPDEQASGDPSAKPASQPSPEVEAFPFRFNGTAKEFFRIWIVNMALSIVTLGIYTAWATVRQKRYMLGNTEIAGSSFDYHANPVSILVSRIVFITALVLISVYLTSLSAQLDAYYSLVLMLFIPMLIARGLSFNARYTSYRTVRFSFKRNLPKAYICAIPAFGILAWQGYFLAGIGDKDSWEQNHPGAAMLVILAVLILVAPFFLRMYHLYRVENHSYGNLKLSCRGLAVAKYYGVGLIVSLGAISIAAAVFGLFELIIFLQEKPEFLAVVLQYLVLTLVLSYLAFLYLAFLLRSWLTRMVLKSIRLPEAGVKCKMNPFGYAWTMTYTHILTVLSLWLLRPWSIILRRRKLVESLSIRCAPEAFEMAVGKGGRRESAIGDVAADAFDFDVGLV